MTYALPPITDDTFQVQKNTTAKKMKFSLNYFLCKCDQIRSLLQIWSRLLKKPLAKNFIFWAVTFLT